MRKGEDALLVPANMLRRQSLAVRASDAAMLDATTNDKAVARGSTSSMLESLQSYQLSSTADPLAAMEHDFLSIALFNNNTHHGLGRQLGTVPLGILKAHRLLQERCHKLSSSQQTSHCRGMAWGKRKRIG